MLCASLRDGSTFLHGSFFIYEKNVQSYVFKIVLHIANCDTYICCLASTKCEQFFHESKVIRNCSFFFFGNSFDPFVPNAPFLYPLKHHKTLSLPPEDIRKSSLYPLFSDVFRG